MNAPSSSPHPLTPREAEILAAIADGDENKHIAHRLGISVRTVEGRAARLATKIGAKTRAHAAAMWARGEVQVKGAAAE